MGRNRRKGKHKGTSRFELFKRWLKKARYSRAIVKVLKLKKNYKVRIDFFNKVPVSDYFLDRKSFRYLMTLDIEVLEFLLMEFNRKFEKEYGKTAKDMEDEQ